MILTFKVEFSNYFWNVWIYLKSVIIFSYTLLSPKYPDFILLPLLGGLFFW